MSFSDNELPSRVIDILNKAGLVTCQSVLESQECDIRNLGCITISDVKKIYKDAAKRKMETNFVSGKQLSTTCNKRWSNLSTGCQQLDSLLKGGIQTRGITEISGQSGCGKTQLCLQLAISVQISFGGLNAGAIYICTEDRFPSMRLDQLLKSNPMVRKSADINFGNNIFIEHISDTVDLLKCVEERLPQFVSQHNIGLIVIDSVAAVFRAEYTAAETLQRARDMRAFATYLHHLANTKSIAIVCVNQVSDVKKGANSMTVPALGLAWANLITCRLQMFRYNDTRQLKVIFSPNLPQKICQYTITEAGVFGTENQN